MEANRFIKAKDICSTMQQGENEAATTVDRCKVMANEAKAPNVTQDIDT